MKFFVSVLALVMGVSCAGTPDVKPAVQPVLAPPVATWSRVDITPTTSPYDDVVLRGATILTANGEVLEGGDIWLRDGKIVALGMSLEAVDAREVDARGKWITPGLIDTHSHLGVFAVPGVEGHGDGNEATNPNTAQVEALKSVWPQDPGFFTALQGGVTVLQVLPGSANLFGGLTATLELRPAVSAQAMLLKDAPVGMKMACGENPKRVYGHKGGPSTRMGTYAAMRATFQKAKEAQRAGERYEEQLKAWESKSDRKLADRPQRPVRDHNMENLIGVLQGRILAHVHCYRADEMVQILELAEEFDFSVRSFHHAVESYKIRDVLAAWNVSTSTWADWWGFKMEAFDAIPENAGLLTEAGARAIIHSDDAVGIQRLNQEAAKAYFAAKAAGIEITEDQALRWITANAAWALGIDGITGTLEEKKRADVVVWSHHPFSVYAEAEMVFVGGVLEYDRAGGTKPWSDFLPGVLPQELP